MATNSGKTLSRQHIHTMRSRLTERTAIHLRVFVLFGLTGFVASKENWRVSIPSTGSATASRGPRRLNQLLLFRPVHNDAGIDDADLVASQSERDLAFLQPTSLSYDSNYNRRSEVGASSPSNGSPPSGDVRKGVARSPADGADTQASPALASAKVLTSPKLRDPFQEEDWHLVAHTSNSHGMFAGNGNLSSTYTFGVSTWYPTVSTPDFQIPFPTDANEIMFVTGDGSIWAITDYPTLKRLIDARAGDTGKNIIFLTSIDGVISRTVGNVLSRKGFEEDPVISIEGNHSAAVDAGRIVWGESSWKSRRRKFSLTQRHKGINVFVREKLYRDPLQETGWLLAAHKSNNHSQEGFAGGGDLKSNYTFGDSTWYPAGSTPDFQISFPVEAKEIMFITGDGSVWAIADYPVLRSRIDGRSKNAHVNFLANVNGTQGWVVGDVFTGLTMYGGPIISIPFETSAGAQTDLVVWGERRWKRSGRVQHLLQHFHGGINVYVREDAAQTSAPGPHLVSTPPLVSTSPPSSTPVPTGETTRLKGWNGTIIDRNPADTPSSADGPSLTASPTTSPSVLSETNVPSFMPYPPMPSPSNVPSGKPSIVTTSAPSTLPSSFPTMAPTIDPTTMPTRTRHQKQQHHIHNVSMVFDNCPPLSQGAQHTWENVTVDHLRRTLEGEEDYEDVDLQLTVKSINESLPSQRVRSKHSDRERRLLKGGESKVHIIFDVAVEVRTSANENVASRHIRGALKSLTYNNDYLRGLRYSGNVEFADISQIQVLITGLSVDDPAKDNIALILGASFGGLFVISIVGYVYYKSLTTKQRQVEFRDMVTSRPFSSASVSVRTVKISQDETSTLGEPDAFTPETSEVDGSESGTFDGQTVDLDYICGAADIKSVSSVGGTLGEFTSGGIASCFAPSLGEQDTVFTDAQYVRNDCRYYGNVHQIEIFLPPGKLGLMVDTPDDGAPEISLIKDSSCVADRLRVGDRVRAIDDVDARGMTAMKLSKEIARRSSNPTRKITVQRKLEAF